MWYFFLIICNNVFENQKYIKGINYALHSNYSIIIVVLLILLFAFVPMRLWITALASGSHVGIGTLIGMRLRKVPPAKNCASTYSGKKKPDYSLTLISSSHIIWQVAM